MSPSKRARRRVAHLTSAHSAYDPRIVLKECASLAKADYEVILIAPHDRSELVKGVRVRPLPQPRGRLQRMLFTGLRLFIAARSTRADVYHFHDPELILVGLCLKLVGKRVIYDVHEDVPGQILNKHWIHPRLRRLVARSTAAAEAFGARFFDRIVVANPPTIRRFPKDKAVLIRNFPLLDEFPPQGKIPHAERLAIIAYVGELARVRGVLEMVAAMDRLPEALSAQLHLAGRFSEPDLEETCRAQPGWRRVTYLGWQHRAEVATLLGRARVGLVTLHPVPNYLEAYPTKLFEYMAAGLPVVCSNVPLWAEIVENAGCGLLVDPLDPDAIAEAMRFLLEHPEQAAAMGELGRQAVHARYNWKSEARSLLAFYASLLDR